MKRALAIINPISGTGTKNNLPRLLSEAYSSTDIQLYVTYTKYGGHAYELAKSAVSDGFSQVVAIGGDGTINEVASALLGSDTALGIVPKGSGNGLARALGIPMSEKQAVSLLTAGEVKRIDCCVANGKPFFCTCGLGFDAEVSAAFAEAPFRGLLSYAQTAVAKYINYKPSIYRIEIEGVEDSPIETEAFVIAAANANQYGNNAYIAPEASMIDGKMDLVILRPFKLIELAQVTLQLFTKRLEENIHQQSYQTRRATICREQAGVVHLDGEPMQMDARIDIEVLESVINVIVPVHKEL